MIVYENCNGSCKALLAGSGGDLESGLIMVRIRVAIFVRGGI